MRNNLLSRTGILLGLGPASIGAGICLGFLLAIIGYPVNSIGANNWRGECTELQQRVEVYSSFLENQRQPSFEKLHHLAKISDLACTNQYEHCGFRSCS